MSLDDLLRVASKHVLVSLGLTVYFRQPLHTFRDGVVSLLEAYLEHAEPHLRWYADTETDRFTQPSAELLRHPRALLASSERDTKNCSWIYLGGKRHEDLTPWFLFAKSNVEYKDWMSFISLTFPIDHWSLDFPGFVEWVRRVVAPLPVFHGFAGFAFGQGEHGGLQQHNDKYILPLAMRFHGVEVDAPPLSNRSCYRQIKGVNWLTLVAEPLLDDLGGVAMTTVALEQVGGVIVHRMPWGLLIQAGEKPEIGDVNQDPKPLPLYRKVNKILRPIRTRTHIGFGDRFEVPETLRWLRRFDDVGENG